MSGTWGIFVRQILAESPSLIALAGAFVYAFLQWNRSPRAAALLAAGSGLLLVVSLGASLGMHFLLQAAFERDPSQAENIVMVVSFLTSAIHAAAIAMMAAAVFVDRDSHSPRNDLASELSG
jgi:hypothetical protein